MQNDPSIILVTGTNGKTTTTHILKYLFRSSGIEVISNINNKDAREERAGDFLELIELAKTKEEHPIFVLEVDEGDFAFFGRLLNPDYCLITNISRNHLEKYGEIYALRSQIVEALQHMAPSKVILCADDPLVASIVPLAKAGGNPKAMAHNFYFFGCEGDAVPPSQPSPSGKSSTTPQTGAIADPSFIDISYYREAPNCPLCDSYLDYQSLYFSNIGTYRCPNPSCDFTHPGLDLSFHRLGKTPDDSTYEMHLGSRLCPSNPTDNEDKGTTWQLTLHSPALYDAYNYAAAAACAALYSLPLDRLATYLQATPPPKSRYETFWKKGRRLRLIRGTNPASMNSMLPEVMSAKDFGGFVIVLDDKEMEENDSSWFWDVLLEKLPEAPFIGLGGNLAPAFANRCLLASYPPSHLAITLSGNEPLFFHHLEADQEAGLPKFFTDEEDMLVALLQMIQDSDSTSGTQKKSLYLICNKAASHRIRPLLLASWESELA